MVGQVVDCDKHANDDRRYPHRLRHIKIGKLKENGQSEVHQRNLMEHSEHRLEHGPDFLELTRPPTQEGDAQEHQVRDHNHNNLYVTVEDKHIGKARPPKPILIECGPREHPAIRQGAHRRNHKPFGRVGLLLPGRDVEEDERGEEPDSLVEILGQDHVEQQQAGGDLQAVHYQQQEAKLFELLDPGLGGRRVDLGRGRGEAGNHRGFECGHVGWSDVSPDQLSADPVGLISERPSITSVVFGRR